MANDALLWQSRMNQAQREYSDPTNMIPSSYSTAFRPDAAAAAASMPLMHRKIQSTPQQHYHTDARSIPMNGLTNPYAAPEISFNPTTAFSNQAYTHPADNAFGHATFGSLSWPAASGPLPVLPAAPFPQFQQYGLYQTDSQSSSDSETYIKTEDDWPIQTYHLFSAEADMFDSPGHTVVNSSAPSVIGESSSAEDEQKPAVFSTDIDTLMRTIQDKSGEMSSKGGGEAGDQRAVQEVTGPGKKRPKKRYVCEVAGCGKSFCQKTHLDIHTVSPLRLPL